MIPYLAVSNIIILFFNGVKSTEKILYWGVIALLGCFIKILFYIFSTLLSHYAAFAILENMRLKIAEKLMRAPLAHMIPEFTSNLLIPLA